jgi:uncharacterized membrane protein YeaQ/YmgE (transglycosylase-associated protein family)
VIALVTVTLDPGSILLWLLIGLIAGFLASKVMTGRGKGLVADIVIGCIGALAGGFLARYLGITASVTSHSLFAEIIIAFVGAVILLAVLRLAGSGRRGRLFR